MMLQLNPDIKPPQNESEIHFLLKQVANSMLKIRYSCQYVANEIEIGKLDYQNKNKYPEFNWGKKITDTVGIKKEYNYKKGNTSLNYTVRNVEVKRSISDLKNGYCVSGDYNYIMAPKNVFEKDMLLPFVGLIEVDMSKLSWDNGFDTAYGVEIAKNPKRLDLHLTDTERKDWIDSLKDKMLRGYTNEQAFRGKWFYPGYDINKV